MLRIISRMLTVAVLGASLAISVPQAAVITRAACTAANNSVQRFTAISPQAP